MLKVIDQRRDSLTPTLLIKTQSVCVCVCVCVCALSDLHTLNHISAAGHAGTLGPEHPHSEPDGPPEQLSVFQASRVCGEVGNMFCAEIVLMPEAADSCLFTLTEMFWFCVLQGSRVWWRPTRPASPSCSSTVPPTSPPSSRRWPTPPRRRSTPKRPW